MQILIVDDHELFSSGLEMLLDSLSDELTIQVAKSCADALAIVNKSDIDLILLDYHLPDSVGREALTLIKNSFSTSIVVIISGEESQKIIQSSIAAGAAGFIPKSSSKEVMIAALKLVLSGGTYLPRQSFSNLNSSSFALGKPALTERQRDVVELAIKGLQNKQIAYQLDIAEGTVKAHLFSAYKVLGVKNRTEAVLAAAKHGFTAD